FWIVPWNDPSFWMMSKLGPYVSSDSSQRYLACPHHLGAERAFKEVSPGSSGGVQLVAIVVNYSVDIYHSIYHQLYTIAIPFRMRDLHKQSAVKHKL
ncbi:hypothetical protein K7432_016386, partial [Basidiobolus ranarum]